MLATEDKLVELEEKVNELGRVLKDIRDEFQSKNKDYLLTFTQRAKIRDIMENFDFKKVHTIMEQLGWKWAGCRFGVPTMEELKDEAKRILTEACVAKTHISTGGFRAVFEEGWPGDPNPYVGLEFILEEYEGDDESENVSEEHTDEESWNEDEDEDVDED